jgi:GDP-L-fucose synthase
MLKILVTGGSGFIGRNFIEKYKDIFDLCYPTSSELNLINSNDVHEWFNGKYFDVVLHCAMHDPYLDTSKIVEDILPNNLYMFFNLMREKNHFDRFINFGTAAEYDRSSWRLNMSEEYFDINVPSEPYGFSKSIINKYLEFIPNSVTLRLFGVFGKYENKKRFISNSILNVLNDKPIIVNQNIYLDYLYVNDLMDILSWFISDKLKEKTYNVCTSNPVSIIDIAKIINNVLGKENSIIIKNDGLSNGYGGNNTKLLKNINNFNFTNIKDAITKLCNWYKNT